MKKQFLLLFSLMCLVPVYADDFAATLAKAEQGDAVAQYAVAIKYSQTSVFNPKRFNEGIDWLQKSALGGYAKAQYDLGCMYKVGVLGRNKLSEAMMWFQMAANNGHAKAKKEYDKLFAKGYKPAKLLAVQDQPSQSIYPPINSTYQEVTTASSVNNQATTTTSSLLKQKQELVLSEVDCNIPKTNLRNENTFVVIIANENYEQVASVPYANNDGKIFQQYCEKALGIPSENIKLHIDATFNHIRLALSWLKDVCDVYNGDASVIFYYAGHGIPDVKDNSSYLLPADGDGRYVATAYKLDELYTTLGSMSAKSVVVFMDACFSGANRNGQMLASERGVALKSRPGQPKGNMVVFSAAQGDETALPNDAERHGMFTYYLLKKLQENKGNITLGELADYLVREVGRRSVVVSKLQTPCVTPSATLDSSWREWKLK